MHVMFSCGQNPGESALSYCASIPLVRQHSQWDVLLGVRGSRVSLDGLPDFILDLLWLLLSLLH